MDVEELEEMVGCNYEHIIEEIPMLGAEVEKVYGKTVEVEFFPNRPDLFSIEGTARAMRKFMGVETGISNYEVNKSNFKLHVDESVLDVRPYVHGAVVKDLKLDKSTIKSLMDLQEALHWGIGRDRSKVSIGIHDISSVNFPIDYRAVEPSSVSFVPLGRKEKMNLSEIAEEHDKGREYAGIVKGHKRWPIISDYNGEILSFPPVINGVLTTVTEDTEDVFIDVTGMDEREVKKALNIIVTALSERGGRIYEIEMKDAYDKHTPELTPDKKKISVDDVRNLIGVSASFNEIESSLERMGYGVQIENRSINVEIPPYRVDIIHDWDIIEDVAIGYGYEKIEPEISDTSGIGAAHSIESKGSILREIMIGMGFQEVMTLTLTNKKSEYEVVGRKEKDSIEIKNPITEEHTIMRTSLLPSLMRVLEMNRHRDLPQQIFEYGETFQASSNYEKSEHQTDKKIDECYKLAATSIKPDANFSEVKSTIQAVMRETGTEYNIERSSDRIFIEGRRANVVSNDSNNKIAVFGEINPEVLTNFNLSHPAFAFEIQVDALRI